MRYWGAHIMLRQPPHKYCDSVLLALLAHLRLIDPDLLVYGRDGAIDLKARPLEVVEIDRRAEHGVVDVQGEVGIGGLLLALRHCVPGLARRDRRLPRCGCRQGCTGVFSTQHHRSLLEHALGARYDPVGAALG